MHKVQLDVFNGVKILTLLIDLDKKKMKVDFIKEFDRDIIQDRLGINENTTDLNVLRNTFEKYLEEGVNNRTIQDYLEDVQDSGFVSPYYPGLSMELTSLKE